MDGASLVYVKIAQDYLADHQPLVPKNPLEKGWYALDRDKVQPIWEEAKRLYEKWKGDTMGHLTAKRRLAFIYQRANELEITLE